MNAHEIIDAQARSNGSGDKTVGEECRAMAITELALWQITLLKQRQTHPHGLDLSPEKMDRFVLRGLDIARLTEDVTNKILELVKEHPEL